jgi:hypothetical protein
MLRDWRVFRVHLMMAAKTQALNTPADALVPKAPKAKANRVVVDTDESFLRSCGIANPGLFIVPKPKAE